MKVISIQEFERFNHETDEYYSQRLPLLRKGEIKLVDFLDGSQNFEHKGIELSTICTAEFEEYTAFFKKCFLNGYHDRIKHEFIHGQIALRNGLQPRYCLLLGSDYPVRIEQIKGIIVATDEGIGKQLLAQPFVVDGVSEMGRDWTTDHFFDYLQETITAVSTIISSGDTLLRVAMR